ncbi:hypothetical protein AVEN_152978-1 [Araneus ventricosus]|uniref:Uncharacterized protein n=1 Tax=Araneus ventricosus TaxID=182803 RepID=A0A4Y2ADU5_ARAVE|nr:hypothetical protein AVEN_152978-1 [Araneus ventricosus]
MFPSLNTVSSSKSIYISLRGSLVMLDRRNLLALTLYAPLFIARTTSHIQVSSGRVIPWELSLHTSLFIAPPASHVPIPSRSVFLPSLKSVQNFSNVFNRDSYLSSFSSPVLSSISIDLACQETFEGIFAASYFTVYVRSDFKSVKSINLAER